MRIASRKFRLALFGSVFAALACAVPAPAARSQTAVQTHPDFSGTFLLRRGTNIRIERANPEYELTPAGQQAFERNKAGVAAGNPEIDTALKCQPLGIPRLLYPGPIVMLILQSQQALGVIAEWLAPARMIFFDSQHRKDYYATYMGDSIARWEGNTMVVDTVNFTTTTFLDGDGFPHSDALHVTERWQLIDGGKTIQNQVTFDDPKIFKAPWSRTFFYDRTNIEPTENVCENTRNLP